jgi:hypothetical protein
LPANRVPENKGGIFYTSINQNENLGSQGRAPFAPQSSAGQKQPSPMFQSKFGVPPQSEHRMEEAPHGGFEGPKLQTDLRGPPARQPQSSHAQLHAPFPNPGQPPSNSKVMEHQVYPAGFDQLGQANSDAGLGQKPKSIQNPLLHSGKEGSKLAETDLNIFPNSYLPPANPTDSNFHRPQPPPSSFPHQNQAQTQPGLQLIQNTRTTYLPPAQGSSSDGLHKPQTSNPTQTQTQSFGTAQFHQSFQDPKLDQQSAIFNQPRRDAAQPPNPMQAYPHQAGPGQPDPSHSQPSNPGNRLKKDLSAWNVSPIGQQPQTQTQPPALGLSWGG